MALPPPRPAGPTRRGRGVLLSLGGALFAALYLLPYKAATRRIAPGLLALPLLLVSALLSSAPLLPRLLRLRPPGDGLGLTLGVSLLLGALSALGNEAVAHALARIDPGVAAVMLRTQVVWVAVGGIPLLGERVGARLWFGLTLALSGMVLLRVTAPSPALTLGGMAWALLAALAFAAMQLTVRRTIHRIDPLLVNTLRIWLAVALLALIPGRLAGLALLDLHIWGLCAAAALSGPILSRLLLMLSLRHIPAALSSLVLFSQPLFAYLLAALLLGTRPLPSELLGAAVVLGGIALPLLPRRPGSAQKRSRGKS